MVHDNWKHADKQRWKAWDKNSTIRKPGVATQLLLLCYVVHGSGRFCVGNDPFGGWWKGKARGKPGSESKQKRKSHPHEPLSELTRANPQ